MKIKTKTLKTVAIIFALCTILAGGWSLFINIYSHYHPDYEHMPFDKALPGTLMMCTILLLFTYKRRKGEEAKSGGQ